MNDSESLQLEGKHSILEALRAGQSIERLYVLQDAKDSGIQSILREAKKNSVMVDFVTKERLDSLSTENRHQGAIAKLSAFSYATVDDILENAEKKGEPAFLYILDGIEDPHNLGAIIRTANLSGAHGVIIHKRRAVGLTSTAVVASAGAVHHTPVARVTNLVDTIRNLKDRGLWFVCADMDGTSMYEQNLTGPIGLVIGNEGSGVSRLVKENCDLITKIPMKGDIDSLNASVAAGVLGFEILRQRSLK